MKYTVIILLITFAVSCGTTKKATITENTNQVKTENVDSLHVVIQKLRTTVLKLNEQIKKTGVVFKTPDCPPPVIKIDSANCNQDSLISVIKKLIAYQQQQANTIKIYADGSKEFTGQIQSYSEDMRTTELQLQQMNLRLSDSSHVADSLRHELTTANTSKSMTRKNSKWWLWLLIGFASCFAIWKRNYIIEFFNKAKGL